MLNIALPKGRLGDKVYDMFEAAGYECPQIKEKRASSYLKTKKNRCAIFG